MIRLNMMNVEKYRIKGVFMNYVYKVILAIMIVVFICAALFIGKNLSYAIWYEDMVVNTIKNSIKQESLK